MTNSSPPGQSFSGMSRENLRIWLFVGSIFFLLILLAWMNEVLDLPHYLMGAPKTPINWRESLLETTLLLLVASATLLKLFHDLSLRRKAREDLRKSEEKFRTFADFTYDWETYEAPDATYIYLSPSCMRVTGRKPAEFMADPGLMDEVVHPKDLEAYHQHQASHAQAAGPAHFDFRVIDTNGETHWISHYCQPVYGDDGRWLGTRCSNRDISVRTRLNLDLGKALEEVKVLRGLIPICAHCKRVRTDDGLWQRIEKYIEARSEAQFTHGLCADCAQELYPELLDD